MKTLVREDMSLTEDFHMRLFPDFPGRMPGCLR